MKKYLLVSVFLLSFISNPLWAQDKKQSAKGFGIEAGVGYNSMNWVITARAGGDSAVTLNHFWLQPCLRLHYDIFLKQIGLKSSLKLKPFVGYYTFGGKLKPDDNGYTKIMAFGSIEAGLGLAIDIKDYLQISPMVKAQYIFSAMRRSIEFNSRPSQDLKADFNTLSANAGLQIRYKYRHFTLGAEAWLGLTNYYKPEGKSAKENNYRLLLGYEF
jgi:hypothetical protein